MRERLKWPFCCQGLFNPCVPISPRTVGDRHRTLPNAMPSIDWTILRNGVDRLPRRSLGMTAQFIRSKLLRIDNPCALGERRAAPAQLADRHLGCKVDVLGGPLEQIRQIDEVAEPHQR